MRYDIDTALMYDIRALDKRVNQLEKVLLITHFIGFITIIYLIVLIQ